MAKQSYKELLGNAESNKVIPAAEYDAVVAKATHRETGNGKTMFVLTFKILGGPNDGAPVFTNLVVSPESPVALGIFFRQMDALGLDAEYLASDPSEDAICGRLEGVVAKIKVEIGEWAGAPKNEIKSIKRSATAAASSIPTPATAPASADGTPPKAPF